MPKKNVDYAMFVPLHNLWNEYICDVLVGSQVERDAQIEQLVRNVNAGNQQEQQARTYSGLVRASTGGHGQLEQWVGVVPFGRGSFQQGRIVSMSRVV